MALTSEIRPMLAFLALVPTAYARPDPACVLTGGAWWDGEASW